MAYYSVERGDRGKVINLDTGEQVPHVVNVETGPEGGGVTVILKNDEGHTIVINGEVVHDWIPGRFAFVPTSEQT